MLTFKIRHWYIQIKNNNRKAQIKLLQIKYKKSNKITPKINKLIKKFIKFIK
jgi:hypothetical protein